MKIEKLVNLSYHDPYNLEYYLLAEIPSGELQILKEYSQETAFGDIRVAVIGSSHFFYLYKEFCELLTCRSLNSVISCFCKKEFREQLLQYQQLFNNFSYGFTLEMNILTEKDFVKTEQDLNMKQHTLYHAFNSNSALTVLDFKTISDESLNLETWHTYPESRISVHSSTIVTRI